MVFIVDCQPGLLYIGKFCIGGLGSSYDSGPWLKGLLSLSSDDSLEAPSDGGLIPWVGPPPKFNILGVGAEVVGPGFGFFPSAMKLPTTTYIEER